MKHTGRGTKLNNINWWGWMNSQSGYGVVNLEYAVAVDKLLNGGVTVGWERQVDMLPDHFRMLTKEQKDLLSKPFVREKVGIIKTTPQMFSKCDNEFRIGYTMVENTRVGEGWVEMCNKMDALLVPSAFLVDVFKESGITRPIKVVKQGINPEKFPYYTREIKDKFTFGTIGFIDERKNWQDMIQAFCSEFPIEPVELVIKNTNQYFEHLSFVDKRIKVINGYYTFEQIQDLYKDFDCYLSPSHAEGSGLTPREAMATGLPTILTNWSGQTEIALPTISYPINPVAIDYPDTRGLEQPGFQARLDVSELMYWMRYAYEHREDGIKLGQRASKYIHENYNWETCAADLLLKVEELL
jgi:glycosyltransferase involved in cell wall biosynthesis